MRINLLYLLVPVAVGACAYIVNHLQGQSGHTFFGTAETEPVILSMHEDVLVREVFVGIGTEVQQGDTLAVMHRVDLEREALVNESAYRQQELGHRTRLELLASERETVRAQAEAKISALRAQISQIETGDSLDQSIKAAVFPGLNIDRTASQARIAAIREEMAQVEKILRQQLQELDVQAATGGRMTDARLLETQRLQGLEQSERRKLVLIAPIDGYVDQLNIRPDMPAPAFRDLLRIYPHRPAKVIGFIHETAVVPFQIGDSVSLVSGARSGQDIRGQIVAASPKLVELPLRLRRFAEVRAWGREVIIHIPQENPYYIGERITISLQMPEQ
jgi:multidrug resistance efflux pump